MSFRTKLKKYSDEFVVMSWNSPSDKEYNPKNIFNLLRSSNRFAKYCGILKSQPNDSQNIKHLYKLISDDDEIIRYEIANKLADIETNKSIRILTKALNDDSRHIRQVAIRSLRKISDRSVVENVNSLLSDKWHNVRLEAAITLYFWDEDESIQYILDLLNDKSKMNRLAGIKFIGDHPKHFGIYAVGPLQAVAKNDRKKDVRKEADELARNLLDMRILDNVRDKIINSEYDYYQLFSIVASLSDIDDEKASEILSEVLAYPFFLEGLLSDHEEEEIKSIAIDFFMEKYQDTKDASFLDEIFSTLMQSYDNGELTEHIIYTLSMCGTDDVLKKAEFFLLLGELHNEDYFNLSKIICTIGGNAAIDMLNDFFELYSDDFCYIKDIFFYDGNAVELFDFLSNTKNIKAHQLLANFLEAEFYEVLDGGLKEKCIIAAGCAKATSTINNLSNILLNKDEGMIIRRKAAQALGAIGTKRAAAALNKVGKDGCTSTNLKKVVKSLRSKIK